MDIKPLAMEDLLGFIREKGDPPEKDADYIQCIPDVNERNCPNCGAPRDRYASQCPYCGTPYKIPYIRAEVLPADMETYAISMSVDKYLLTDRPPGYVDRKVREHLARNIANRIAPLLKIKFHEIPFTDSILVETKFKFMP